MPCVTRRRAPGQQSAAAAVLAVLAVVAAALVVQAADKNDEDGYSSMFDSDDSEASEPIMVPGFEDSYSSMFTDSEDDAPGRPDPARAPKQEAAPDFGDSDSVSVSITSDDDEAIRPAAAGRAAAAEEESARATEARAAAARASQGEVSDRKGLKALPAVGQEVRREPGAVDPGAAAGRNPQDPTGEEHCDPRESFRCFVSVARTINEYRGTTYQERDPLRHSDGVIRVTDLLTLIDSTNKNMDAVLGDLRRGPYAERVDLGPAKKLIQWGDIHGSLHSVLRGLLVEQAVNDDWTVNEGFHIASSGDVTDRGPFGVDVYYLLLRLKIASPGRVTIAKGNHESMLNWYNFMFTEVRNKMLNEREHTVNKALRPVLRKLVPALVERMLGFFAKTACVSVPLMYSRRQVAEQSDEVMQRYITKYEKYTREYKKKQKLQGPLDKDDEKAVAHRFYQKFGVRWSEVQVKTAFAERIRRITGDPAAVREIQRIAAGREGYALTSNAEDICNGVPRPALDAMKATDVLLTFVQDALDQPQKLPFQADVFSTAPAAKAIASAVASDSCRLCAAIHMDKAYPNGGDGQRAVVGEAKLVAEALAAQAAEIFRMKLQAVASQTRDETTFGEWIRQFVFGSREDLTAAVTAILQDARLLAPDAMTQIVMSYDRLPVVALLDGRGRDPAPYAVEVDSAPLPIYAMSHGGPELMWDPTSLLEMPYGADGRARTPLTGQFPSLVHNRKAKTRFDAHTKGKMDSIAEYAASMLKKTREIQHGLEESGVLSNMRRIPNHQRIQGKKALNAIDEIKRGFSMYVTIHTDSKGAQTVERLVPLNPATTGLDVAMSINRRVPQVGWCDNQGCVAEVRGQTINVDYRTRPADRAVVQKEAAMVWSAQAFQWADVLITRDRQFGPFFQDSPFALSDTQSIPLLSPHVTVADVNEARGISVAPMLLSAWIKTWGFSGYLRGHQHHGIYLELMMRYRGVVPLRWTNGRSNPGDRLDSAQKPGRWNKFPVGSAADQDHYTTVSATGSMLGIPYDAHVRIDLETGSIYNVFCDGFPPRSSDKSANPDDHYINTNTNVCWTRLQ